MDNVQDSFFEAVKERLASPIAGIFIVFWLVYNWQALLFIAFDHRDILARMYAAESLYASHWTLFTLPALWTIVYVVFHPILLILAAAASEVGEVGQRRVRQLLESGKPFSKQEKVEISKQLRQLRDERDSYYQQLLDQRSKYITDITQTQQRSEELQQQSDAWKQKFDQLQSDLERTDREVGSTEIQTILAELRSFSNEMRRRAEDLGSAENAKRGSLTPPPTPSPPMSLSDIHDSTVARAALSDAASPTVLRWFVEEFGNGTLLGVDPSMMSRAKELGLIEMHNGVPRMTKNGKELRDSFRHGRNHPGPAGPVPHG